MRIKTFSSIPLIIIAIMFLKCTHNDRNIVDGKSELVSVTDTLLNDSVLIEGSVWIVNFVADYPYENCPYEVWIDNSTIQASTDSTRNYIIKTIPGTYSIKCQVVGNKNARFIEGINNLKVMKNQKVRINFYLGVTAI
jgi:hypothetical protein